MNPRFKLPIVLAAIWAVGASAQQAETSDLGFDVSISPEAASRGDQQDSDPYYGAWLIYALARGEAYMELQNQGSWNRSADDFLIEYRARDAMARVWQESRADRTAADPYLDRLVETTEAGFLDEYVALAFAKPGWTIPGEYLSGLELDGFVAWWSEQGDQIDNPTYAMAEPRSGPLWPVEPGAGLPDPNTLLPPSMPCSESMPILRDAVSMWQSEADRIDGIPIASADLSGFLNQALSIAGQPGAVERGATWVSNRTADIAFLGGFCAIEVMEFDVARPMLELAVALRPFDGSAKSELAHVYVSLEEYDLADSIIGELIAGLADPCALAREWRRRGFIRFEQGRLDEAREAYLTSLQFEPKSELALSELAILDQEIIDQGGTPLDYTAPEVFQSTTECTR